MPKNLFLPNVLFVLLLLTSLLFNSFEAVIIVSFLLLIVLLSASKSTLSVEFINIVNPLIAIVLIAIISSLFRDKRAIDFIKDFLYLLKPILFLIIGYLFSQKVNDRNKFFQIIIYTAAVCAIYHIFQFITYFFSVDTFSMNKLRPAIGRDNFLELIALALIIANTKYKTLTIKYLKLITVILAISFVLYFSRTMFGLIIILSLAFLGYLRISKKGLNYIFIGLIALAAFYTYLFSIKIDRDSKSTLDIFLYKLKSAPAEVFMPKKSFDVRDHAELWDHWRAYEAHRAISQLNTKGVWAWSFGTGAGSLIDLGFYAPISNDSKGMRYITNIHNGYVFVLFKTGILGVLFYLLFLIGNFLAYKKSKYTNPLLADMIFGIVLFYLSTSLVITGVYNLTDTTTLILGGILFLNHKES